MGMTQGQQQILDQIAAVVRQREELNKERDRLILAAVEANISRATIAQAAQLSEPMIYKIRRDELEKREAERAGGGESGLADEL
ncbi:hypothetical protein NDR87_30115 [Nocardia sp. CDC159]|uniref:Uncharacterized protein n=1 Tax=Nocardia pulmonis TaxID=2951408 RepID=A0A9X2EGH4_9NOCA|nr:MULTISPECIES: hypothetical protein [Nocardia]MCM6777748.1 hypothetical protein [Nocardia pulmonis]MCM6790633.1 hypothetical protein [Nocardia sp. CDC159]